MYHINDENEAKPCKAQKPESCRFWSAEDPRHYADSGQAFAESEKRLDAKHGKLHRAAKYSFVKNFKQLEENFKRDFENFPNRFFNADLRGKVTVLGWNARRDGVDINNFDPDTIKDEHISGTAYRDLAARMFTSVSDTKDAQATDEEMEEALTRLGADSVETLVDVKDLRTAGSDRAWVAQFGDEMVVVTNVKKGSTLHRYRFRMIPKLPFTNSRFTRVDARSVMGAVRAEEKTGQKLFSEIITSGSYDSALSAKRSSLKMLQGLEEAQVEGQNFTAQRKYIKEHSGKIATAYMEKKDTDEIRKEMMKNSRLNGDFAKIDLDNSVDPIEFAEFESAWDEVKDKLPKIPEDRKPNLGVRRLGKHKALGVYFPHVNTVVVDVNHSSSAIHELGHMYDMAVHNNASLSQEFRGIQQAYSKALKVPAGEPQSRFEYLTTSTEVFARFFECFANSELGVDNRLLNADRFSDYDYDPIMKNPELKEQAFTFFKKLFKEG